ncbi:MAG: peptide chain release factor N(5)-glutamine methyltransferase [Fimbriimonadaceae bacterium]|nr:peptide chain release factor N(5)-glutamine methyltransferase [Fimbriimonadaceae bacterium]
MTVQEWVREAAARLQSAGIESAKLEAQVLAAHVLNTNRTWILTHPTEEFYDLAAETLLQRREGREPLAYIVGRREFFGRMFRVRPGVLIPRQETETLLEAALASLESGPILDIGTGSGCLAITLKLERPEVNVTGLDISPIALDVASGNAESLGAEVDWVQSDLFECIRGRHFEIIVSNPPYIGIAEPLIPEVRDFEPGSALFAGKDGLDFYRRLASETAPYLAPDGRIFLEVGHEQSDAVKVLFIEHGWKHETTVRDLSGSERVVSFSWRGLA